ncbi:MAG TPA: hypothetical protein VD965_07955 [Burkholderiales bacterium]|nr:hypothetical protein [Burkholderiales bacterium]
MRQIFLLGLLLAGCSQLDQLRDIGKPSGPLNERMDAWLGKSVKQLTAVYGPPANTTELPGRARILQYPAEQQTSEARATYDRQSGTWVVWPRPGSCPTLFTVSAAGVVERWSVEGSDCR